MYDGLVGWEEDWEDCICNKCALKVKELHASGRQSFWNKIPSIYGLPDWEELKNERISYP